LLRTDKDAVKSTVYNKTPLHLGKAPKQLHRLLDQHTSDVAFGSLKDIKRKQETPVISRCLAAMFLRNLQSASSRMKGVVKM
jgi:hypothetical protein